MSEVVEVRHKDGGMLIIENVVDRHYESYVYTFWTGEGITYEVYMPNTNCVTTAPVPTLAEMVMGTFGNE